MVRKKLKRKEEQRETFTGVFVRMGTKPGWYKPEKTILLKNVKDDTGQVVTDHLWFNYTKRFQAIGDMFEGDVIQFDARVKKYYKGYFGRREEVRLDNPPSIDYKLSYPTRIEMVKRARREPVEDILLDYDEQAQRGR